MKKAEIIEALAEKTGLTKADVARVYEGTFGINYNGIAIYYNRNTEFDRM